MRDLGPAIISAGEELARGLQEELGVTLSVLGCHLHFLKDIGKDILQQSYDEVKKGIGTGRLKSKLRELIRDIGRRLGTNVDKIRQDVARRHQATSQSAITNPTRKPVQPFTEQRWITPPRQMP